MDNKASCADAKLGSSIQNGNFTLATKITTMTVDTNTERGRYGRTI